MSLTTIIYLASLSSNLSVLFGILTLLCFIFGFISIMNAKMNDSGLNNKQEDEQVKKGYKFGKIMIAIAFIPFLICALLPCQKTIYAMLAVSYAKEIQANPKVNELEDKALKALNVKLDNIINGK